MLQHPLYSPWTLWFDSPATKGRNLPQTPMTSFPQTPLPQTPGGLGGAAQGWMEDIKRVINFDSVEEFWGCVIDRRHARCCFPILMLFTQSVCTTTSSRPPSFPKRQIIIFSRSVSLLPPASLNLLIVKHTGRDHSCLGGRGQQGRRQVEHSASKGKKSGQRR